MLVRSSNSSVLKWPDKAAVHAAAAAWAAQQARQHPGVLRIGYFGSYARGDWGVGSDVDLVAIVDRSNLPFEHRSLDLDAPELPVPADLLVYTAGEWESLAAGGDRFYCTLAGETVWLFERQP